MMHMMLLHGWNPVTSLIIHAYFCPASSRAFFHMMSKDESASPCIILRKLTWDLHRSTMSSPTQALKLYAICHDFHACRGQWSNAPKTTSQL